jgi:hypothetical protein
MNGYYVMADVDGDDILIAHHEALADAIACRDAEHVRQPERTLSIWEAGGRIVQPPRTLALRRQYGDDMPGRGAPPRPSAAGAAPRITATVRQRVGARGHMIDNDRGETVARAESPETAATLVRIVNAHDDMLASLKALRGLAAMHADAATFAQMTAAIEKAESLL